MSLTTIAVIGIFVLFLLILSGTPVAFSLALVGFFGFSYVAGWKGALSILGQVPYHTTTFYEYVVIPLFMFMGMLAFHSGISKDLFKSCYKWFGHLPGGLAISGIGGCAFFSAICGSSMPTAATMGVIALPEMKKYNYAGSLATGSLAAGGTLGVLIPPSIGLVVYGIIAEQSIGKLLIAGILPGIMLSGLFILTVYIQCRINPSLGPAGPKTSMKEKFASLVGVIETLIIFVFCIGGIYIGFFTPVEAASIGALATFILGLVKRKLSMRDIKGSIIETGTLTAMVFAIIIGAYIFGYFISVTELPINIARFFAESSMSKYLILTGILLMYLVVGCVMDFFSMMILTLPIIFPLIVNLGFDPIWFGIIMVIMLEMGQITPPVGINVYTIKGVAPDVPILSIFWGVLPFWLAMVLGLIVLIVLPQIILFLPNKMY